MVVIVDPKILSPVNVSERKTLDIRAGDTVRVHQKIEEKGKTRIQIFEGLVLARKHGAEAGATFTVRATLSGVGVEKIFPLYSPLIDKIEIVRRSKVRRAKLYYIRDKVSREIRRQLRNMISVSLSTTSEREAADEEAKQAEAEATQKAVAEAEEAKKSETAALEEQQKQDPQAAPETAESVAEEEPKAEISEDKKES